MNKDQFDILPNYVNTKLSSINAFKSEKQIVGGLIEDICHVEYQRKSKWFLYFKDKYDLEHDGLFWSLPQFELQILTPVHAQFTSLNMRISMESIPDNMLTVRSNDEIIFQTDITGKHFDIEIPYASKYHFSCKPHIPKNDNRELGIYISEISILDLMSEKHVIPYSHLTSFISKDIIPV